HGWSGTIAGDAYGVVARYAASVFGYGPRDHAGWHRLVCAACVIASPPAQFLPAAIAIRGKAAERRVGRAVAASLAADAAGGARLRESGLTRGRGALRRNGRRGFGGRVRIAQVIASDRFQLIVQLVDERDARRDVELDDLLVADVVEVLDQGAQAVAVRGDEH